MSYKNEPFKQKSVGMAFGYAKDLACHGKIGLQDIDKYARQMYKDMNELNEEYLGKGHVKEASDVKSDKPWLNPKTEEWDTAVEDLKSGEKKLKDLFDIYKISKANKSKLEKFES